MMAEKKTDSKNRAIDFLLAEYIEHTNEKKRYTESGIVRLNFFITLTSSVLGGLVVIAGLGIFASEELQMIALLALSFLLIVGWGTLNAILDRSLGLDRTYRAMARIRAYYIKLDPEIRNHLTWQDVDEPTPHLGEYKSNIRTTIRLLDSIMAAFIVGLAVNLISNQATIAFLSGVISFLILFLALGFYIAQTFKHARLTAQEETRFPSKRTEESKQAKKQ